MPDGVSRPPADPMTPHDPAATVESSIDSPSASAAEVPPWLDRAAWTLFGVAAIIAAGLILWFGRDTTFSVDEMDLFMETPDLDLRGAFEPHVGHLILTTRILYRAIFSTFGVGYLPFQLLTVGVVILNAGLFLAYASRRIGKLAALAPALVLLVFGSDPLHVLAGNGFTIIGALACGLGALLALDRGDRKGDVIAAGLLCLGVVTYSVALPFVVGVAISILLRRDRWQRAWIFLVPVALYFAWWLWTLGLDSSSEGELAPRDVLLWPSWAYQSLSAVLGALAGLDYSFGDGGSEAGPTLAVVALIAVGWRFRRGPVPSMLWAALAIALSLWLMGAVSIGALRTPDTPRYLYPGAIVVLIAGAWLIAGLEWRRWGLVALFLLAVTGAATNVAQLRTAGVFYRAEADQQRAVLAGFQIAGPNADPGYVPMDGPSAIRYWTDHDVGDYLAAVELYGAIGYSPDKIGGLPEPLRVQTDQALVSSLALALAQPTEDEERLDCVDLDPDSTRPSLELMQGQTVALESDQPTAVTVGRFADAPAVTIGTLQPDEVMTLRLPSDEVPDPWHVSSEAPTRACIAG